MRAERTSCTTMRTSEVCAIYISPLTDALPAHDSARSSVGCVCVCVVWVRARVPLSVPVNYICARASLRRMLRRSSTTASRNKCIVA